MKFFVFIACHFGLTVYIPTIISMAGNFSQLSWENVSGSYDNLLHANLIAGGKEAKERQFPFIAYFNLPQNGNENSFCAGTIYDRLTLITARHCVSNYNPSRSFLVIAGTVERFALSPSNQIRYVGKILRPDGGSDMWPGGHKPDIALLKLKQPFHFNEFVQPIDIMDEPQAEKVKWATVAGWGRVSNNFLVEPVNALFYTEVKQLPSKLCHSLYQKDPFYLCFGDPRGGRGPCFGDSGGPLVVFDHRVKAWKQLGIISLVPCEDGNQMGFYTDLTKLRYWVHYVLQYFD